MLGKPFAINAFNGHPSLILPVARRSHPSSLNEEVNYFVVANFEVSKNAYNLLFRMKRERFLGLVKGILSPNCLDSLEEANHLELRLSRKW